MKKLLKEYGFNSDMQYFEMIAESFTNGQRKQAIEQFKAMPKSYRITLLKAICGSWDCPVLAKEKDILFDNLS